jgi:3-oxoadipate enol-lactonase
MKKILVFFTLFSFYLNSTAAQMNKQIIETNIGNIAVFSKTVPNTVPIIFLHGVYFDHHLWDHFINQINDRTVIAIDMPLHGESNLNIVQNWTLNNCAAMLIEILDSLHIEKVIAIGHSWGSMTILRAASKAPTRFASIGVCNMPWENGATQKTKFVLQHTMLSFRKFYTKQAASALFGKQNLRKDPSLLTELARPMNKLTNAHIKQIDKAVIVNAQDVSELLSTLQVKAKALIGIDDYLKPPPNLQCITVQGGHVSPLQARVEVMVFIKEVTDL